MPEGSRLPRARPLCLLRGTGFSLCGLTFVELGLTPSALPLPQAGNLHFTLVCLSKLFSFLLNCCAVR